jgi:general secretion pathway protein B
MSYILEALKKSQQERELGRVPRLQAPAFEEPVAETRPQSWVFAALGMAAVAVVVAAYSVLRSPTPQAPLAAVDGNQAGSTANLQQGGQGRFEEPAPAASARRSTPIVAEDGGASPPLALEDPDDLSVEPQVLVVPAPAKPGERLPRGADELRRAVLGPEVSPSVQRRAPAPARAPTVPEYAPVPPELIAEIEAFKRAVDDGDEPPDPERSTRNASSKDKSSSPNKKAKQRATEQARRPAPLSASLRRQMPPFSMTVHVYDEKPSRRFVYVNGKKIREGEESREGFLVEQVVADGAIIRYEDQRFFQNP